MLSLFYYKIERINRQFIHKKNLERSSTVESFYYEQLDYSH